MLGRALSLGVRATSTVLHGIGVTPMWRNPSDPRLVLYHGIGDNAQPCLRHLRDEIPEALLDAHVAVLRRRYRLASFDEALTTPHACSLTFDDGLASVYDWLLRTKVPATVFINSAVLTGETLLWQHRVSYLMAQYGVTMVADALTVPDSTTATGFQVIDYCQHHYAAIAPHLPTLMARFGDDEAVVAKREAIYLTPAQIRDLSHAGVGIASHTARHLPLAHVPRVQMLCEINDARATLALLANTNAISFPFGMRGDYGDEACEYARRHYGHVLEVGDGYNDPPRAPQVLGRVGLGTAQQTAADLYAAIEVQPAVKSLLRLVRH